MSVVIIIVFLVIVVVCFVAVVVGVALARDDGEGTDDIAVAVLAQPGSGVGAIALIRRRGKVLADQRDGRRVGANRRREALGVGRYSRAGAQFKRELRELLILHFQPRSKEESVKNGTKAEKVAYVLYN